MERQVTDTVLIVCMNILAKTNTNLIDPAHPADLTPQDVSERIYGSKLVLVVEQMQIITVWLVKCCLLIMYARLTMSLKQNIAVKFVAAYVAFGFVLMEILYLAVWCRPFTEYWAVPTSNIQCSAATNHLITNAVLNITSDVMIILIPMPVFLAVKLPIKRKAILVGVFALGIFTVCIVNCFVIVEYGLADPKQILSAILNKYYSFNQPFGDQWTFWYIRESSTAIITANLPFTWTLLQNTFNLKSFNGKSSGARTSEAQSRFRSGYGRGTNHLTTITRGNPGIELGSCNSQEQVNDAFGTQLKIYQQTEVHVSSHDVEKGEVDRSNTVSPGVYPGGASDSETSSHESEVGVVTGRPKA
ncbi:hypothetical protein LQW54_012372 [Pestalotiopsis sp. IQ-011]